MQGNSSSVINCLTALPTVFYAVFSLAAHVGRCPVFSFDVLTSSLMKTAVGEVGTPRRAEKGQLTSGGGHCHCSPREWAAPRAAIRYVSPGVPAGNGPLRGGSKQASPGKRHQMGLQVGHIPSSEARWA